MSKITLRIHQEEMVQAARTNPKGIIQSPTGSGKTFAQAGIVADLFNSTGTGFSITIIKTPRIGLSNQVSTEYTKYFKGLGLDIKSILIHSGDAVEMDVEDGEKLSKEKWKELASLVNSLPNATSSIDDLKRHIEEAKRINEPVVIYTTYHSNQKVYDILNQMSLAVDLDINDEAHYLVREDFSKLLNNNPSRRQYFFTATLLVTESNEGKGMQNQERFGDIIFNLPINKAIDDKLILPVKPIAIRSELGAISTEDEVREVGQIIMKGYDSLAEQNEDLGTKMLVAVKGAKQITNFINSEEFNDLIEDGIEILTVHSKKELTTYNGNEIKRSEFDKLKDQLGEDPNVNLIIVHYDILAEGIDVPGLLGVLILRRMKEAKFLQTVGRVVRVYRPNPELKKFGTLLIPQLSDLDIAEGMKEMLANIAKEGYIPEQLMEEYLTSGEEENEDELDQTESYNNPILTKMDLLLYSASMDYGLSSFDD